MTTVLTEIETILITCLPAITAIISIVAAIIKFSKNLNSLKDNESLKAERDALKEQNQALVREAKKQTKLMQLYIEKASKIAYNDMTEVQNDQELQD